MAVGREMLGAASCYSLCSQIRASLQDGKLHICIRNLVLEVKAWLMQIHRPPARFSFFSPSYWKNGARGFNGREVVGLFFLGLLELHQFFVLMLSVD